MKSRIGILTISILIIAGFSVSAQVSQVQYDLIYNTSSGLYEAHAYVTGASLTFPSTIPYPSKFSVVVPASISDAPFTVVQSVNPPGMSWSQSNSIYAPAAAPNSDFHAFSIAGGGGNNAYPVFSIGTDILLFTFSVPYIGYLEGIRCFVNETDPNSSQSGMNGVDFSQSFKTKNIERYAPGANIRISGYVMYNNNPDYRMSGVNVQLKNASGVIIGTTSTTSNPMNGQPGYFAFNNIPDGTGYKLTGSYNGTWGGNNATDALIVQMNVIGQYPLSGLYETVADVNASSTISGLDALYIKLRTIGSASSYPAGDWKISESTFTLSGAPVTEGLTALCVGDVNGSFDPTGSKSAASISVIDDGVVAVPVGEAFIYNIRSNKEADLGAMTLFLGFDPNHLEIVEIASMYEGLKYECKGGNLSIAWADTKPLKVNKDGLLLSLKLKVKEKMSEPSRIFTIKTGSEFADISAKPYLNFDLKMAGVLTPDGTANLSIFNYPNPFSYNTTIVYTLPEQGRVRLMLTDLYGKTIRTLNDKQEEAGLYTVLVDPDKLNLVPGVYIYKLIFDSAKDNSTKVNKMVFTR